MSNISHDKELLKDFKWIQEEPTTEPPVFEETEPVDKTLSGVLLKRFGENALVPIGIASTTACLVMGLGSMQKGDHKNQQLFMRGRVFFQAFTFVAMTSGILLAAWSGKDKKGRRLAKADETSTRNS